MDEVWLVVSGEYSDYRVACAFATSDLAVRYAARMNEVELSDQEAFEVIESLNWPEYRESLAVAPATVRELASRAGHRTERLQFFEALPVVDEAAAKREP